ncbi:MAG: HAMP domain-containing protein [Desulfobacterales bacterium]|nr:HAMP domain-containing protein [Desulfobacterales bacterium]
MTKQFKSIKTKLIRNNMLIIFTIFLLILLITTAINIHSLNLNIKNSLANIQKSLIAKGFTLVSNNSLAMSGLAEDYAITAIQQLVSRTVEEDNDMIYGIYMDAKRIPWVTANSENPKGIPINNDPLADEISQWAVRLKEIQYRTFVYQQKEVIEFASPVFIDTEIVGYIRYGFGTDSLQKALLQVNSSGIKTRHQTLLILVLLGILSLVISYIIVKRLADRMTDPILSLTKASQIISNGDYTNSITVSVNDEIGQLAAHFEEMRIKIKKYTDHLQDLVDEKMQQVRDILDSINQGLFTINLDGSVNKEYSLRANTILQVKDVAACSLAELLRLNSQPQTSFEKWLKVVQQNYKRMRWNKLVKLAPISELVLSNPENNAPKFISISYQIIYNKSGELNKIMILAQDETESRLKDMQMVEERKKHEHEMKMILAIANTPADELTDFMDDVEMRLKKVSDLINHFHTELEEKQSELMDNNYFNLTKRDKIDEVYRHIHTMKGNSGSYGFDSLIEDCHLTEELIEELKKVSRDHFWGILNRLHHLLSKINDDKLSIHKMIRQIFGEKDDVCIRVPEIMIQRIQALCTEINTKPECVCGSQKLIHECLRLSYKPISSLVRKYQKLVNQLARKQNKKINFIVTHEHILVHPDIFTNLDDMIIHLLRNAVDHGIECNTLRKELGKGVGKIQLSYNQTEHSRIYTLSDDGKGINSQKLIECCIQKGIITLEASKHLTEQEIFAFAFYPGVSLANGVTDISGRGIGLNAVKDKIEQLGGTIQIQSVIGKGTLFTIIIPDHKP